MKNANEYQMSEDFIGWELFIPKSDWDYFEDELPQYLLKKLRRSIVSGVFYESKTSTSKGGKV